MINLIITKFQLREADDKATLCILSDILLSKSSDNEVLCFVPGKEVNIFSKRWYPNGHHSYKTDPPIPNKVYKVSEKKLIFNWLLCRPNEGQMKINV